MCLRTADDNTPIYRLPRPEKEPNTVTSAYKSPPRKPRDATDLELCLSFALVVARPCLMEQTTRRPKRPLSRTIVHISGYLFSICMRKSGIRVRPWFGIRRQLPHSLTCTGLPTAKWDAAIRMYLLPRTPAVSITGNILQVNLARGMTAPL